MEYEEMPIIETIEKANGKQMDWIIIKSDNDIIANIGISNKTICCEDFGISIPDDYLSFIGAKVKNIKLANSKEEKLYGYDNSAIVIIETEDGRKLPIICWINNYDYPHEFRVYWPSTTYYDGMDEQQMM